MAKPGPMKQRSGSNAGPPTASLAMLLIGVGTKLREHLDGLLAEHDITMRHLGALGHLAASPELSMSDLARRARVTPQSMRATVDHLDAIGAIEHRRHGQGRASELVVTTAGEELLQAGRELIAGLDDDLLDDGLFGDLGELGDTDRLRDALLATMIELRNRQHPDDLA